MAARGRSQPIDPQTQVVINALNAAHASANQRYRTLNAATLGLRQALAQRAQGVTAAYDKTDQAGQAADQAAQNATAGLSSNADAFKAITAGESSSGIRRAAEARAAANDEIGKTKVSIANRQAAGQNQIGQDYQATIGKISDAALSQLGKQQTATALENQRTSGQIKVANIRGRQANQRQQQSESFQRQQQQRSQDFQRQQRAQRQAGKGGAGGKLPGTPSQRSKVLQVIAKFSPDKAAAAQQLSTRQGRHNLIAGLVTKNGVEHSLANWAVHEYQRSLPKRTVNKRTGEISYQ